MDLISGLSQALGVNPQQAEALAGAALATVKGQAADQGAAAAPLAKAVPEMDGWMAKARAMMAEAPAPAAAPASPLGAALGFASSGLGNQLLGAVAGQEAQDAALFAGLLGRLGLDAQKAAVAAPLVADFLRDRLDPATFDTLRKAAPFLQGGGAPAGAASVLGGLFG
jgi:hypothetical protein